MDITQHGTQPIRKSKSFIDHKISDHEAPFCIFKASKKKCEPRLKFVRDERRLDIKKCIADFQ